MIITVAQSITYGNYKWLQNRVEEIKRLIKHFWVSLCEHMDFNPDVNIHIRPIKGCIAGKCFKRGRIVEIDPRFTPRSVIETLAHELTHSEQFYRGHLQSGSPDQILNHNITKVWKGVGYRPYKSEDEYRNTPWEVEAHDRAALFIKEVWPEE